jgi:hypothetical protein
LTVQDDERERELVRLFNLEWDPAHQRSGVDALLRFEAGGAERVLEVEVKSTTGDTVSTARDVGIDHIHKWRHKMFVIGFYTRRERRPELVRCLCLTPDDMAPWIDAVAQKVEIDHRIAQRASAGLRLADVSAVCGRKRQYSIDDAKAVLRQQWSAQQYVRAADDADSEGHDAYSPAAMLAILRLRALYIAQRGATLNNPHITRSHLAAFFGTDREVHKDWASRIRAIAASWWPQHNV